MIQKDFNVTGMTCAACQTNVEKTVKKLSGVENVSVNLLNENMSVTFNEKEIDDDKIINAVISIGYGASLKHTDEEKSTIRSDWETKQSNEQLKQKSMKRRLFSSVCFLIPLMYIAMGGMLKFPMPQFLTGTENILVNTLTQLILTIPVLIINKKFFTSGFKALLHKAPNMDSLVAIGSSASFIYGLISFYFMCYGAGHNDINLVHKYSHELYFESAAMILTLVTVGKYLETKSKAKTSDALGKLINLAPKTANVLKNGFEITIPAEDVKSGDTLIIRPGESIPVDGIVIEGEGSVDQSAVTGESLPIDKTKDDSVICATINKNGTFKMVATKVGNDTTLSQIIKLVDNASNTKAPIARLADKVSGVFVPIVIFISIITFAIWFLSGATPDFSLSMGITVLVISCPCALGLATPVAIMAGTGKAAENGILIKSAEALEKLSSVDTVVLDKTGTVTTGEMSVADIFILDKSFSEEEFLSYAYSLENSSEHPLANAIKEKAKSEKIHLIPSTEFSAEIGKGISATIDGDLWFSGNYKFMLQNGIAEGDFKEKSEEYMKQGKTSLVFAKNKKAIGIIAISDTVKEDSKYAIDSLKKLNKKVIILTGDNASAAECVANEVGADEFIAEVLPTDKEKYIRELKEQGKKVCMIGDGINDSPALITADIGMAIGAGTDIAIDSADIVLMKSTLQDAVTAFELSKAVIKNIKINLFWAFFYNALGIPVAAGVFYPLFQIKLTPMLGSLAMSMSSLCVVTNALRLRFFKTKFTFFEERKTKEEIIENKKTKEDVTMTKTISVEGMMCNHCKAHVETALKGVSGVTSAEANLEAKTATATLSSDVDVNILIDAVKAAGYDAKE